MLRPRAELDLVRVGGTYGGWWIPRRSLKPGAVIYCAGAGEDISFDLEMHGAGCVVRTFDPTPRAIAYVEANAPKDSRFSFLPLGLWHEDTEMRFYEPSVAGFVSHSAVNLYKTDRFFVAPVRCLQSLMREFGDDHIDVLKMDIEGAEVPILHALMESGSLPPVICVEFDQPQSMARIVRCVRAVRSAGYRLAKMEHWNLTFVARD